MKTAFNPAFRAGLISERGEFPTIQVRVRDGPDGANNLDIGAHVFFRNDADMSKMLRDAGSLDLAALLGGIPLGEEHQLMPRAQILEGFTDAVQELDIGIEDIHPEIEDFIELSLVDLPLGQSSICLDEIGGIALGAIAVGFQIGPLDLNDHMSHFFPAEGRVLQVVDEGIGGALEINVVVPERVIRVDENRLALGSVRVHDSIFVLDLETYVRSQ